ncbi:uncharacterized protein PFLUO_LOCUS6027 [Penicillium psychrofluorescens]|uniref:uncharacterized protein n=1 Tax=Penicillium psychrofluorescens TaxID=3158075 RepID=UPI003CCD0725
MATITPMVSRLIETSGGLVRSMQRTLSGRRSRSLTAVRITDELFNLQTPQRAILIRQLKEALVNYLVPAPFWACVQVCDIANLEFIIQLAQLSEKAICVVTDLCCALPYRWMQRPSPWNDLRTDPTKSVFEPRGACSRSARLAARERDGQRCVLTGAHNIYQVAHIYPTYFDEKSYDSSSPTIWKFVRFFWSAETAERWHRAVYNDPRDPAKPLDTCANLICLRNDLRAAWANGLFALRPVSLSDDGTSMEVEFYWQPKQSHKPYGLVDIAKEPGSSKDICSVDDLNVVLPTKDNDAFRPIESGHIFTLRTDDPVNHPLPSYDLLEMQWHLNRIVGMSAAAALFREDEDSDDDEEEEEEDNRTAKPLLPQQRNVVEDWIQKSSNLVWDRADEKDSWATHEKEKDGGTNLDYFDPTQVGTSFRSDDDLFRG